MHTFTLSTFLLACGVSLATPVPQAGGAGCKSFTLLFARGTGDPNMGGAGLGAIVGPGLKTAVEKALGTGAVNVLGVNYPADAGGIMAEVSGTGPGSTAMTKQATSILSSCPQTRLILSGYSQGGMVVHNAITKLKAQSSSIAAVVTFGDPYKGTKLTGVASSKWRSFCGAGDGVCGSGACAASSCASASTSGHTGYGSDTTTAATFIKSVVGSGNNVVAASESGALPAVATETDSSPIAASPTNPTDPTDPIEPAAPGFPFTLPTGFP